MTVHQLIEILQNCNQSYRVIICDIEGDNAYRFELSIHVDTLQIHAKENLVAIIGQGK